MFRGSVPDTGGQTIRGLLLYALPVRFQESSGLLQLENKCWIKLIIIVWLRYSGLRYCSVNQEGPDSSLNLCCRVPKWLDEGKPHFLDFSPSIRMIEIINSGLPYRIALVILACYSVFGTYCPACQLVMGGREPSQDCGC